MNFPSFFFFLSITMSFTVFVSAPEVRAETNWVTSTRTSILALDSAKRAVLQDISGQGVGQREAADYQDFVAYLNSRIISYCEELEQKTGPSSLVDLPCLTDSFSQSSSNPFAELASDCGDSSGTECSESLDTSFMDALADFDDMLLKEEEKMSSRIPSKREAGGGENGSGQSGIGGAGGMQQGTSASRGIAGLPGADQTAGADGEIGEKAGSSTHKGDTSGSGGAGVDAGGQSGGVGRASGNRPPPKDDDIVARQLREAAERETDPELKKKLWDEYWKYKGK